jgi:hypothetical protein
MIVGWVFRYLVEEEAGEEKFNQELGIQSTNLNK